MILEQILSLLDRWERRTDHDLGPDYLLASAWILFFADGSGCVVAELHQRSSTGVPPVDNLLTAVGIAGCIERAFPFASFDELRMILSRPIKLEYSR